MKDGKRYHGGSCLRDRWIDDASKKRIVAAWPSPPVKDRVRSPGEFESDTIRKEDATTYNTFDPVLILYQGVIRQHLHEVD